MISTAIICFWLRTQPSQDACIRTLLHSVWRAPKPAKQCITEVSLLICPYSQHVLILMLYELPSFSILIVPCTPLVPDTDCLSLSFLPIFSFLVVPHCYSSESSDIMSNRILLVCQIISPTKREKNWHKSDTWHPHLMKPARAKKSFFPVYSHSKVDTIYRIKYTATCTYFGVRC